MSASGQKLPCRSSFWILCFASESRHSRAFRRALIVAFERKPPEHGFVTKSRAQPIDGAFRLRRSVVEQIGEVGCIGIAQRRDTDAEQAEFGAVNLAGQQFAAGGKDTCG